ncbi:MAG: DUF86 domain-containing protein [Bacteroidota bacterium]|nr:DUF86 domain-containing protein [Bacteroidota bacterium]
MSKREIKILPEDMIESIRKINRYIKGMTFVVRNLEIIGEAANRISKSFQLENPQVEWRQIIGLRNRVIHDYFGIDYEIVWQVVTVDLKKLKKKLKDIICLKIKKSK